MFQNKQNLIFSTLKLFLVFCVFQYVQSADFQEEKEFDGNIQDTVSLLGNSAIEELEGTESKESINSHSIDVVVDQNSLISSPLPSKISCYVCLYTRVEDEKLYTLTGLKNYSYTKIDGVVCEEDNTWRPGRKTTVHYGIVNNPGQHVFPGGTSEPDESLRVVALREFEEETGVKFNVIGEALLEYNDIQYPIYGQFFPYTYDEVKTYNVIDSRSTSFGVLYISCPSLALLNVMRDEINGRLSSRDVHSDELQCVKILEVESDLSGVADKYLALSSNDSAFYKTCLNNHKHLSTPFINFNNKSNFRDLLSRLESVVNIYCAKKYCFD